MVKLYKEIESLKDELKEISQEIEKAENELKEDELEIVRLCKELCMLMEASDYHDRESVMHDIFLALLHCKTKGM